jgi:ParB family transcriptional regulator, chromosome partitioning protein
MAKPALGRGLGALLGGVAPAPKEASAPAVKIAETEIPARESDTRERVERVALQRIKPCAMQPRKAFPEESLQELADSIKAQGIVQPLIVRASGDGYELIAGERRWRAAQRIGLTEVPVLVREADDRELLELALIENLQRENLNPLEEALGYAQLIDQFKLKQEEVGVKVGKSRAAVANALRLLKLPPAVQEYIRSGRLSVGHAKVLMGLGGAEEQIMGAERVLRDNLSVRQTEELVGRWQHRPVAEPGNVPASGRIGERDPHVADLENRLKQRLSTKVSLRYRQGRGSIEIRFFTDEDLDRVLEALGVKVD